MRFTVVVKSLKTGKRARTHCDVADESVARKVVEDRIISLQCDGSREKFLEDYVVVVLPRSVEPRPAFIWTCDDCGEENCFEGTTFETSPAGKGVPVTALPMQCECAYCDGMFVLKWLD